MFIFKFQWTTIRWKHCPLEKELSTLTPVVKWEIFLMHFDMSSDPAPLWLIAFMSHRVRLKLYLLTDDFPDHFTTSS